MNEINIQDIVSEFGKYYIDGGQNLSRVLTLLKQKSVTPTHARSIITIDTLYRFANTHFGEIVQQFQQDFTHKGSAKFTPNEIQLRQWKVDYAFFPDAITESWLGFLSDLNKEDRKDWPIVRYILEVYLTPQIEHDLELNAYGKGVYEAPANGVAGTADKVMDGLVEIVRKGLVDVTKPMNNLVTTLVPSKDNGVEFIETLLESVDTLYLDFFKFKVFADPVYVKNYQKNYRDLWKEAPSYTEQKAIEVDFHANVELVALPSLKGTKHIIITPADNFVNVRRKNGINKPVIGVKDLRQVQTSIDGWEALGFGYNELVWVYKQA